MTPGSIQFRKHCEKVLPQRGGEPKAQYIARLARHFGLTTSRMTVLYYDQRKDNARFTTTEYNRIFLRNTSGSTPSHLPPHLTELKTKLEEQQQEIKWLANELNRERETRKQLGTWLLSQ